MNGGAIFINSPKRKGFVMSGYRPLSGLPRDSEGRLMLSYTFDPVEKPGRAEPAANQGELL